jgi:IMP dehydrogenase
MRLDKDPKYSYQDVFIKPAYSSLNSRTDANTSVLFAGLHLSLPVVVSNMDTITESEMAIAAFKAGAIAGIHRFMSIDENVRQYKEVKKANADCFCSLGVKDYVNRLHSLYTAGCRRFIVDIANAWCVQVEELMKHVNSLDYRKELFIVLGNVGTVEGALALKKMGADAIKVCIGTGSICTTKNITGVNSPNFSTVMEISQELDIPVIADGGFKEIGDFAKALGAGATLMMSGSFFAGCQETPPVTRVKHRIKLIEENIEKNESNGYELDELSELIKSIRPGTGSVIYRGMASFDSMKLQSSILNDPNLMVATPEGKEVVVPVKGNVASEISAIAGGLRSAMSYSNARTVGEFKFNVEFGVRYNP